MYKKFSLTVIFSSIVFLILAGLVVFIIDPFVHFHAPIGKLVAAETNEYYQNTGVARNMDYDTVVTGSSMAENFQASWFDDGFDAKTVKLTFQGGQLVNYDILFEEIFRHGGVKRLFFPLDNFLLTDAASSTAVEIPEYLYGTDKGEGLWESMPYLLNKDVLIKHIPKFLVNNVKSNYSVDKAYTWGYKFYFSREATLASYFRVPDGAVAQMQPDNYFYENTAKVMDMLIPYIEENPETEFYIWFPPYSILYWDDANRTGSTNAEISAQSLAAFTLLQYDNVKLFYFQNDFDVITNLDNYKDYSHYKPDINYDIYRSFLKDTNRLTPDNYHDMFMETKKMAETYDFEQLFR